ncbi:hypothetical protein M768_11585 [Cellulosimicrobium cellulans F16]|uniref:Uncharacterized protein n=1 Tax=Cellulosimicrobium cellulans F16 TaxID=1350482 RepID=A0A0M0F888_CELCE|nr:hypothetical protein M768_11585 [Cellulosimicrobium cellulans F16]
MRARAVVVLGPPGPRTARPAPPSRAEHDMRVVLGGLATLMSCSKAGEVVVGGLA